MHDAPLPNLPISGRHPGHKTLLKASQTAHDSDNQAAQLADLDNQAAQLADLTPYVISTST
eukprot:1587914-Amphidinium_carterae.1